jgi:hypothetical protein
MKKSKAGAKVIGDVMSMLFMGFAAICVLILALINEVAKKADNISPPPQGTLMVEAFWPDNMPVDVDLWVMISKDNIPVGYSNKGSEYLNLLRDDLGHAGDITNRNMEITYSRGLPDGEYIINIHLYSNHPGVREIPVSVVVSMKFDGNDSMQQLIKSDTILTKLGEEKTMARFTMKDGRLVPGSVNKFPIEIRSKKRVSN